MFRVREKNAEPHVVITAAAQWDVCDKIWSNSRGVLILPSVKSWTLTGQRMVNLLREIEVALSHLTLVGSALTYRAWRPLRTTCQQVKSPLWGKLNYRKWERDRGEGDEVDVQSTLYLLHHHIKHSLGVYATIIKIECDFIHNILHCS